MSPIIKSGTAEYFFKVFAAPSQAITVKFLEDELKLVNFSNSFLLNSPLHTMRQLSFFVLLLPPDRITRGYAFAFSLFTLHLFYSGSITAAAITVVHNPPLSPSVDWVILKVLYICPLDL